MRILVLGGDGYLGWPTAMDLSRRGHEVTVADNYFRRQACDELDAEMLYSVPDLLRRAEVWQGLSGNTIKVVICDLTEAAAMRSLFDGSAPCDWPTGSSVDGPPDAVVHYAEQPSAPYSLIDHAHASRTISNNLLVTNNLIFAIRDFSPDTHIIKLGTMGEYGTPDIDIEEGWIDIEHKGRSDRFLFPRQASSIYHMTKIMDTDLLWFSVRTWDLRVTDLMQGPVYGIETDETSRDEELRTFFNYDEIFGTVINRFIVQAIAGYPLTVYGSGGQTRGYLNIRDTLQCVERSFDEPAAKGELRIFNQIMESFSVRELAEKTRRVGRELGYDVQVEHIENPRREAEEHYYNPVYQGLLDLGVEPHYLTDDAMAGLFRAVERYSPAIRKDVIFKGIKW